MNEQELRFIIKMTDQASATLKQIRQAAEQAGGGAKNLKDEADGADLSLGKLISAAKDATIALTSFWASSKTGHAMAEQFGAYEEGMRQVEMTTHMTTAAMEGFKDRFRGVSQGMQNIPTEKLLEYSQVAGRLGARSTDEVLTFSAALAKLDRVAVGGIGGEEGARDIGRLMSAMNEGIDTAPRFAEVLLALEKDTKASTHEILNMAGMLAQATAGLNMTSGKVLALSAALTQLNERPGTAANSLARIFLALQQGAQEGGKGIEQLAGAMGMTRLEFNKLLQEKPEQALFGFLNVVRTLQKEGRSPKNFLQLLGLNGIEDMRMIALEAQNLDKLISKDKIRAEAEGKKGGSSELDSRFDGTKRQTTDAMKSLSNAWEQLEAQLGKGFSVILVPALETVASGVNMVTNALSALDGVSHGTFSVIASTALVAVTGLGALRGALGAVRIAASLFGLEIAGGTTALGLLGTGIGKVIGWAINLVAWLTRLSGVARLIQAAFSLIATGIAALAAAPELIIAGIVAAFVAAGVAIYAYWDDIKAFFAQSWTDIGAGLVDALTSAMSKAISKMHEWWDQFVNWLSGASEDPAAKKGREQASTKRHSDPGHPELLPKPANTAGLTEVGVEQLKKINPALAARENYRDMLRSIKEARENMDLEAKNSGQPVSPEMSGFLAQSEKIAALKKEQLAPSYEAVKAARDQLEAAEAVTKEEQNQLAVKQALRAMDEKFGQVDPAEQEKVRTALLKAQAAERKKAFDEQMLGLEDQLNAAVATTKAQQNRLDIEKAIREAIRQQGYDEDQLRQIRSIMEKAQAAEIQKSFNDQKRSLQEQIAIARALTQEEKDRLDIAQQTAALVREKGYSRTQADEIGRLMDQKKQADAMSSLRQQLDPVAAATIAYANNVRVLDRAMREGTISADQYKRVMTTLQLQTLDQRDPFAAQVLSLKQQIALTQLKGQYADADRQTMQTVLQLQKQGVQLTDDQIKKLAELNRELDDQKKEQSSGLTGWANSVGTLKDNLLDLTKDFGSGLSQAITGALEGKRGSWTKFLAGLGDRMISTSVNQILKVGMQEGGLDKMFDGFAKNLGASEVQKPFDLNLAKQLQAQVMEVVAGTVNVTGAAAGVPSTGAVNDNTTKQAVEAASSVDPAIVTTAATTASTAAVTKIASSPSTTNVLEAIATKKPVAAPLSPAALPAENQASLDALTRGSIPANAYDRSIPASIRTNNPGAMWFAPWERKYGALGGQSLKDGLGQNNNAAMFPTMEAGGAAQFELLQRYGAKGWDMRKAIKEWSGGNSSEQYARSVAGKMGTTPDATLASQVADRDSAIRVAKAMAQQEAGRKYPMSDDQWSRAWQLYQYKTGKGAAVDPQTTGSIPKIDERQMETAREAQRGRALTALNDNQLPNIDQAQKAANDNALQQAQLDQQQQEQLRQAQQAQEQYAQSLQQTSQTMAQATPELGGFGQGITGLLSPLANAIPGLGKFGRGIMGLASQLLSGLFSGGGKGGGGGFFGSLFGGLFHGGGEVGTGSPTGGWRALPVSAWSSAPRYHTGLGNDEFPAVLQRGERVLTRSQNYMAKYQMGAMADTIDRMGAAIANANSRGGNTRNMTVVNNISTPNADSFRRSDGQRAADTAVLMQRMGSRNN